MRIAIRGEATPLTLGCVFQEIASHLNLLGVEKIWGTNVYLKPCIDDEELILVKENGQTTDTIEMWAPKEPGLEETRHPFPRVLMYRHIDVCRTRIFANFLGSLRLSRKQISSLLGISEENLGALAVGRLKFEFDAVTQERITTFAVLFDVLRALFPSWHEMLKWFSGPHLHTKLDGDSPLEQLQKGGALAALEMTLTFERLLQRKRLGLPTPLTEAGYYDVLANF